MKDEPWCISDFLKEKFGTTLICPFVILVWRGNKQNYFKRDLIIIFIQNNTTDHLEWP